MKQSPVQKQTSGRDAYKLFHYVSYLNYIIYLCVGSLLFMLMTMPFVFLLMVMELRLATLPFFIVTASLIGSATSALFGYLKDVKEKDQTFILYFKFYRQTAKRALIGWLPSLFIIGISSANLLLMTTMAVDSWLKWLMIFILIAAVSFSLVYCMVVARFQALGFKQTLRLAVNICLIKSVRCALNVMILMGSWVILTTWPIYLLLFGIGITALLIQLNMEAVFESIES